MFAVTAAYGSGEIDLIGFANDENGINELVNRYIARFGEDFLRLMGVSFRAELAA